MTRDDIVKTIQRVFEDYGRDILFAYLFGSTVSKESTLTGDIDCAVFLTGKTSEANFETKLSLYAALCRVLSRNDVDLVVLNDATNLILVDEIVQTGLLLVDRDREARMNFELAILHRSLDFRQQRRAIMGV